MIRVGVVIGVVAALLIGAPAAAGFKAEPYVVGGRPANPGEYPAQAWLVIDGPGGWSCGGTLLAPTRIVTAAHCVTDLSGDVVAAASVKAYMGENDRNNFTSSHEYGVSTVDVHSEYDPSTQANDVAMLTLTRTAAFSPLRMIWSDEAAKWAPGVIATVIGWGTTSSGGDESDVLLEAEVPIVSDAACADAYEFDEFDAASMVCAHDGAHDTCQGDSGGPLMVPDVGAFALAGITSWGIGCADPR